MRTSNYTQIHLEQNIRELSAAFAAISGPADIERFLRAILTEAEVAEIAGRWELVKLLESGMTQRRIAERLHMSLCKITRGSKELKKPQSALRSAVLPFVETDSPERARAAGAGTAGRRVLANGKHNKE